MVSWPDLTNLASLNNISSNISICTVFYSLLSTSIFFKYICFQHKNAWSRYDYLMKKLRQRAVK